MKMTYPLRRKLFPVLLLVFSVQCAPETISSKYNWDTINYVTINRALRAREGEDYQDVEAEYQAPVFGTCGGADGLSNFTCE